MRKGPASCRSGPGDVTVPSREKSASGATCRFPAAVGPARRRQPGRRAGPGGSPPAGRAPRFRPILTPFLPCRMALAEEVAMSSIQHKLDRVRRPRVQNTYDVETNGAMQKVELPFVVGVLADLSAQSTEPLKPLKDRPVVDIDRDNFNNVMAKAAPRVATKVQNRLTDADTKLAVELKFKHIDDFEPAMIAEQVPALKELLDMRNRLTQLLSKMEGNDKLDQLLADILSNSDKAKALAKELGIDTEASSTETK